MTTDASRYGPLASLDAVAGAIRAREVSPLEVTRATLDRIERLEPRLHAFAHLAPERALDAARQAESEIAQGRYRGPLHGVPIAVKDLCDTADMPTTCGMPLFKDRRPAEDATVVKRLRQAGAVILGKLEMTEGAFGDHHPSIEGPVNPWGHGLWAGASSSGSGVATAAGFAYATLGSDTGGSIRFPAACCGITGLKPSYGLVSRAGVFALAFSMDHVGPMTRSALDAGHVLQAIAGFDPADPTTPRGPLPDYLAGIGVGVRGVRLGFDRAFMVAPGVDPRVVAAAETALDCFAELGADVREVHLPDAEAVIAGWTPLCATEAALVHHATFPAEADAYGPMLRRFLEIGRATRGTDMAAFDRARRAFTSHFADTMRDLDLLLLPAAHAAELTVEALNGIADPAAIELLLRFTTPANMTGHPTITFPSGATAAGLPIAVQLLAAHGAEALLLRACHAFQQSTDWHRKAPPGLD